MPPIGVIFYSLIVAVIFAVINLYTYRITDYIGRHKRKILSLFGGITAAFVFLDLLPTLQQSAQYLRQVGITQPLVFLYEDAIFLVVLIGFLAFFTLEHITITSRTKKQKVTGKHIDLTQASNRIFIIYLATTAILNFVLSFILMFEFEAGITSAILFATGVSLHLFISSNTMTEHYKTLQTKIGRYIIGAAPLIGWIASMLLPESIAEAYVLLAFVSGVILYHAIKDELPTTLKKSGLAFFLIGALLYAALIIGHAALKA